MVWTDLFKSKSGKLKPDPRIRWFGKLPTYPDYYRSPADEGWAVEFADWVMKGFELYQGRKVGGGRARPRMPVGACILRLPKSGMTVLASILDFGGDQRGRPFPLCFYVGVPTPRWSGPTSDRLHGASRVVNDLLALRRDVAWFVNSPGHFETVFGNREVDLDGIDEESIDRPWAEPAKALAMADWFEAVKPELEVEDQTTWLRLAAGWGDNLSKYEGKDFEPTLRFPLAMNAVCDVQVAGWIRWLESRLDLRRRLLSLVISGDLESEPGHLAVIARDIVPDDFLLLTSEAKTLVYLDDLSGVKPAEETDEKIDGEASGFGSGTPGSWIEFVEAAATVT